MRILALLSAVLAVGCGQAASPPAMIAASAAQAAAIGEAGSTTPIKVLSTKRSTYGVEAANASMVDPGMPVWVVLLSGTFQPPSCGSLTATPHPCPSPATTELILINARTGRLIQAMLPAPTASLTLTLPCISVASDDHGTVVAAFDSTIGAIRDLPSVGANPELLRFSDSQVAVVCYIDGQIPRGPPPPPSGSIPPSFDRAVIVVVGGQPIFILAGYRESVPIRMP